MKTASLIFFSISFVTSALALAWNVCLTIASYEHKKPVAIEQVRTTIWCFWLMFLSIIMTIYFGAMTFQ